MILDRPTWQVEQMDPRYDYRRADERMISGQPLSLILNADSTGLNRFAKRGGRLIIYLAQADAVILPGPGVAYYQRLAQRFGGLDRVQSFARLFLVPGMQHCQGGPMPNAFGQAWVAPGIDFNAPHNIRSALEAWVERGRAPTYLVAAKYDGDRRGGRLVATRRLRPYPRRAGAVRTMAP
jgi:feruloyl esterase